MHRLACLIIAGASLVAPTAAQSQSADTPRFIYSQDRRADTRTGIVKPVYQPPHAFSVNFDGNTLTVLSSFDPSEANEDTSVFGFDPGSIHITCSRDQSVGLLLGHDDLRKFFLHSLSMQTGEPLNVSSRRWSGVKFPARWELAADGRERGVDSTVSLVGIKAKISFSGENLIALLSDFYRTRMFVELRLSQLDIHTFNPKPTITFMLATNHLPPDNSAKVPLAQALNFCENTVSLQQRTKR